MDWLLIAAGAVLAVATYANRARLRALRKSAAPAAPKDSSPPPPALDQEQRQALFRHAAAIDSFVEKSSHPRELFDDPDFQQAVALLSRPDIPPEALRQ